MGQIISNNYYQHCVQMTTDHLSMLLYLTVGAISKLTHRLAMATIDMESQLKLQRGNIIEYPLSIVNVAFGRIKEVKQKENEIVRIKNMKKFYNESLRSAGCTSTQIIAIVENAVNEQIRFREQHVTNMRHKLTNCVLPQLCSQFHPFVFKSYGVRENIMEAYIQGWDVFYHRGAII